MQGWGGGHTSDSLVYKAYDTELQSYVACKLTQTRHEVKCSKQCMTVLPTLS